MSARLRVFHTEQSSPGDPVTWQSSLTALTPAPPSGQSQAPRGPSCPELRSAEVSTAAEEPPQPRAGPRWQVTDEPRAAHSGQRANTLARVPLGLRYKVYQVERVTQLAKVSFGSLPDTRCVWACARSLGTRDSTAPARRAQPPGKNCQEAAELGTDVCTSQDSPWGYAGGPPLRTVSAAARPGLRPAGRQHLSMAFHTQPPASAVDAAHRHSFLQRFYKKHRLGSL